MSINVDRQPPKRFAAKYFGTCQCGESVHPGMEITYKLGRIVGCQRCDWTGIDDVGDVDDDEASGWSPCDWGDL
jgi:hypothetical protein